jgi:hypothetical protein
MSLVVSLILAIFVIGVYANSMKQLRRLEQGVQTAWGDVEWRLEERNKFLPEFLKLAKKQVNVSADSYKRVNKDISNLTQIINTSNSVTTLLASDQLDVSLNSLIKEIDQAIEDDFPESFFIQREELFDLNSRLVVERQAYERSVVKLKQFVEGYPGRWITPPHIKEDSVRVGISSLAS